MEDKTYKYPVALKWDQGPERLKEVKNKLVLYFGKNKKSDGGECELRGTDCSRGYIFIHFKDEEAQQKVLKKTSHELQIGEQTLKLEVFPPEETMGSLTSSHHDTSDKGASGSSQDTDHQQEHTRRRKNEWKSDFSSTDKRPKDDSTGHALPEGYSDNSSAYSSEMPSSGPASLARDGLNNPADSHTSREEARRNSLSHMSTGDRVQRGPGGFPEIFKEVKGSVYKDLFNQHLQREIITKIPSLRIQENQDVVKVSGTFDEIKMVHQFLLEKLNGERPSDTLRSDIPRSDTPRSDIPRSETPRSDILRSDTPRSDTLRSGTAGNAESSSATDIQKHQVCLSSALYEYIMEIYRSAVEAIERKNRVKFAPLSSQDGTTHVTIIPQGPESSPEKAEESFTDKVQEVMGDWYQEKVDPSVVPLTFFDIKQRLKDNWRNVLVIQEGNMDIFLRGPRDELSQAIQFLKKDNYKSARPRRTLTISSGDIKTEVPVDARHLDILKKLKSRELYDIEKKYNVKMDERNKNGSVIVTFRAIDVTTDLSPHASHSFTTLLQKTFFNMEKKEISVGPEFQEESIAILQEDLMMGGVDVVMEYSKGSVLLIGHPVHVAFVVEILTGKQNPGRHQAAASSEEPMDTDDTSANHQPKAEEPDNCPVCLCEIEDKDRVTLEKCKHAYCRECLRRLTTHKPMCAICGAAFGTIRGDQPDGTMTHRTSSISLPGYSGCGSIEISYNIPGGTQKKNHPHPGKRFYGTDRTAYLPDNREGREILQLLKKAFDQRLTFTVGESRTTGATDTVTWNDIHHKTSTSGGPQQFGYPDPDYLKRVRDELKAKGVE